MKNKKPAFKIVEVRSKPLYFKVFPLLYSLMAEEANPLEEKLTPAKSWVSLRKAQALGYRLFAAVDGKEILGVMGLTLIRDPLSTDDFCRVNNLIVRKDQRGRGLGTAMMKAAEARVKKEGAAFIMLEVLDTNKKAISFYNKMKYKYVCDRMLKAL